MARTTVLLGAAAIACSVAAAAPPQPADPVAADLARDWVDQKARMIALAEAMPAERYDFKATPPQRTFGEQLAHLAEAHVRMLRPLDPGGRVPAPEIGHPRTREAVIAAVAAAYDYGRQVIEAASPSTERAGERTRARAVWAAMNNAMNHYGQCVVYLRLNGIVPPASRR
jgi:uncharacterized damage-inducible protein DinB